MLVCIWFPWTPPFLILNLLRHAVKREVKYRPLYNVSCTFPASQYRVCKTIRQASVLNPTWFTQYCPSQDISTMKAIFISLMLCIGICTSSPARILHKRETCDTSGFSDYGIRFPNTRFRACVWDFFKCLRTQESLDYSEFDVRSDSTSDSCCNQRFDVCYNYNRSPERGPSDNDTQDSDYSDLDVRSDSLLTQWSHEWCYPLYVKPQIHQPIKTSI